MIWSDVVLLYLQHRTHLYAAAAAFTGLPCRSVKRGVLDVDGGAEQKTSLSRTGKDAHRTSDRPPPFTDAEIPRNPSPADVAGGFPGTLPLPEQNVPHRLRSTASVRDAWKRREETRRERKVPSEDVESSTASNSTTLSSSSLKRDVCGGEDFEKFEKGGGEGLRADHCHRSRHRRSACRGRGRLLHPFIFPSLWLPPR